MSVEEQLESEFDSGGHPSPATLAGVDLDSFDPATTERIRSHVGACPQCQAGLAGLRRTARTLADAPYPAMPEDVFARLQTVIRTEQSNRAQPNVVDLQTARARRRRRTQWIGAAAAGVAVVAAVGITVGLSGGGDETGNGQYAGPQPSAVVPSGALSGAPGPGSGPAAAYTRRNLGAAVADIVKRSGLNVPGVKVSPAGAMQNPAKRAACVAALGEQRKLLAVQQATFEGRLGFVFVFDKTGGAPNVHVVGPACGNGTADERYSTRGSY